MEKRSGDFNSIVYFRFGAIHLGVVVDNESQRLLEFEDAKLWLCIPPDYGFIWEKLKAISLLHGSLPLKKQYCTLSGLLVKGWYMLVIGHCKYIISSSNGINILAIAKRRKSVECM